MREIIFLTIGMLIGGTVGALMLCLLRTNASCERIEAECENDERH